MAYHDTILAEPSLVSYWQLTEPGGSTTFADSKGTNPLTLLAGVTPGATAGIDGMAAAFNGNVATGYARTAAAPIGFPSGTAPFSHELWFKTTASNPTDYTTLSGYGTFSGTGAVDTFLRSDQKSVGGGDYAQDLQYTRGIVVNDGWWHHHVISWATSPGWSVYLDGVLVAGPSALTPNIVLGTNPCTLGASLAGGVGAWNGYLGHAAVYSSCLSAAAIQAHYAAGAAAFIPAAPVLSKPGSPSIQAVWSSGLAAGYPLDAPSGITATDLTGGHNGSLSPGMSWTTGSSGRQLQAADNAGGTFCDLGVFPELQGASIFTISALAALDAIGTTQNRILFGSEAATGECRLMFYLPNLCLVWQLGADGAFPLLLGPMVPLNVPILFTARLASGGVRSLWYGATKVAERTDAGILYPSSSTHKGLGGSPANATRNWSGPIIDAIVATRAYSDAEIASLAADPFVWERTAVRYPVVGRSSPVLAGRVVRPAEAVVGTLQP